MNHDLSNKSEKLGSPEWTDIMINGSTFAFRKNQRNTYSYCHNAAEPKVNVDSTLGDLLLEFSNFLKVSGLDWIKIK
jgi:fructose/tagatose bisphosphate aldolase